MRADGTASACTSAILETDFASGSKNPTGFSRGSVNTSYNPDIVDPMGWSRQYTTGFLSSMAQDQSGFRTEAFKNQYFEARFSVTPNPGSWPSFWTLTANNYVGNTFEPCDELDIMEGYMPDPQYFHFSRHQWNYGDIHTDAMIDATEYGGGANIAQTFQTYGMLITEETTYMYFNNILVHSAPTLEYSWSQGNYFMITNALQMEFMNNEGGFHRYGDSGDMYIDWVRVYQE